MSRFTIFSIILAISAITIMADVTVRDYFNNGAASVIEALPSETAPSSPVTTPPPDAPKESEPVGAKPEEPEQSEFATESSPAPLPPAPVVIPVPPEPAITSQVLQQAGFTGKVAEKHFEGKVYQLLDITKNPVDSIGLFEVSGEDAVPIATVTEIVLRDEIRALQLYVLLQNKTKPYIDLSLNETNAYGDRSFYINHAKKPDEAFLTVKIKNRLYAVAYVKLYHPQVKELIQILNK